MTQITNDQKFESLSALIDNEAGELEMHRVLKHIGHDEELRAAWRRYQITSSILRRESDIAPDFDVSKSVAKALDSEITFEQNIESESQEASRKNSFVQQFLGKAAVAASVAAVMVLGLNQMRYVAVNETGGSAVALSEQAEKLNDPVVVASSVPFGFEDIPLPEARTVSSNSSGVPVNYAGNINEVASRIQYQNDDLSDPATQALLNQLLIEHAQRSSVNGSLGFMPFARVSQLEEAAAR